ncbi:MAG: zinc-ribbon domain-containing protein [Candidatus Thorarchaeota archaeon]
MFCHNCGQKLDDSAVYCEQCGIKVGKEDATKFFNESDALFQYHELEYELGDINDEVSSLRSKEAYLNRLKQSRNQKFNQLQQIRNIMLKEKKDYNDLLKVSFSSIKARLRGDLDEKKRFEEAEYLEALANFQYIEKEYQKLETEITSFENEINRINGLKSKISSIEEKMEILLAELTAGKATDRLKDLETNFNHFKTEMVKARDIQNKFMQAGELLSEAENYLSNSVDKLRLAEGLGTWDTFFRGGFFVDSMKHGNLDGARNDINQAQTLIARAKDLVDVIDDIYIDFEAPNLFFDMFFDNFFFDLFGNAKITRTRERVEEALHQLVESRKITNQHQSDWEKKRNELVVAINDTKKKIREERLSLL